MNDDETKAALQKVVELLAPLPFTLEEDVHPQRAFALGQIFAIAEKAISFAKRQG